MGLEDKKLSTTKKEEQKSNGDPFAEEFWLRSLPLQVFMFPFLFAGK